MRRFEVALIGRPNVGKSTLFNRLVGKRLALVDDTPGVTRDRRVGPARLGDLSFDVIDTAGLDEGAKGSLIERMRQQTETAIRDADLSLFLVDARAGLTTADSTFAELLRKGGKPVIVVANKAEGRSGDIAAMEAFALGLGEPVAISAEHGEGFVELRDAIAAHMPVDEDESETDETAPPPGRIQVAIVGRPNAGKSTLINTMIGEERLLTGPEAGITRDAIAVDWTWRDQAFRLVDTAGMRKRAKIQEKLEKLSVADALHAIRFAEVVILTIDAADAFDKQDLQIADLVEQEGRALVVAVSKWDLVEDRQATLKEITADADEHLAQLRGVPIIPVSGLNGEGIDRLLAAVVAIHETWNKRIPTAALNRWLEHAVSAHPPPAVTGRAIRIRYMTQSKARPPTFIAFCSRPEALPDSYRRYLVGGLRDAFKLKGVPIRLMLRKGDNPYAGRG